MHYCKKLKAFTIVELLVVIVVIGILAAITIISYSGVSKRASLASLQSDLSNASTKLKAYQAIYGSYPTLDASNCPSAPAVDVNYCLKFSPSSSIATTPFAGYVVNNTTTPKTFSLTLTNNDRQGVVTESSKPSILTPAPLDPVADWIATPQGDHYGNYYDPVSKSWATVTRSTPKTIYDPATQHIYDVPANYLAINPWSAYQPGGNGSAAVIEEARTNYLLNSSFEADTNGDGLADNLGVWYGSSITKTSLVADAMHGSKAQRFVSDNSTSSPTTIGVALNGTAAGSFAAGESATISVYAKDIIHAPSKVWRFYLYAMDSAGAILGSVSKVYSNSAGLNILTYSNLPANTSKVWGYLAYLDALPPGDKASITIDAAQIEKGAFATSYIPTTTTAATRNTDAVTIPTDGWNKQSLTAMTLHGYTQAGNNPGNRWLWSWYQTGGEYLAMYWVNGSSVLATGRTGNVGLYDVRAASSGAYVSVGRFKANDVIRVYVNGSTGSRTDVYIPTSILPTYASIGGPSSLDGPLSRLAVYSTALSDQEVSSLNSLINGP